MQNLKKKEKNILRVDMQFNGFFLSVKDLLKKTLKSHTVFTLSLKLTLIWCIPTFLKLRHLQSSF